MEKICCCPMDHEVLTLAKAYGFEHIDTGGGCCALFHRTRRLYIGGDDGSGSAPYDLSESVYLTLDVHGDGGTWEDRIDSTSLLEALQAATTL